MAYQSKHTGKQIDDGIDAVGSKLSRTDDLTNNVVTFVEAGERTDIASGDTAGTLFGKILKWLKSLGKTALSNDYNDLDNKPTIPSEYELPVATADTLGGIKIGTGLSITNGVVSTIGGGEASPKEVFIAQAYSTTHNEIKTALANGKLVFVKYSQMHGTYMLPLILNEYDGKYSFMYFYQMSVNTLSVTSNNEWSEEYADLNSKQYAAEFGSTYFSLIDMYVDDGYVVWVDYNNHRLQLTYISGTQFEFTGFDEASNTVYKAVCKSNNQWTMVTKTLATESYVDNAVANAGGEISNDANTTVPIYKIWVGTQEEYEAITTLDANTEYNIIEE